MKKRKKIAIFTGSRSEYGLLRPLIKKLSDDIEFKLQLIVSGMHLSPEFGMTIEEIILDNIEIEETCEILLSSDNNVGIIKSMGIGLINFSETIKRLKPDLVILLGDRFESFSFAIASYYSRVPIAHIHGGELTQGSLDDNVRHSITKLSHYHFTSTEEYRKNVIQLGENPSRVYNVGAIGLDSIKELKLLSKNEVENRLGKKFIKNNFLITFHPPTAEGSDIEYQINELLKALETFKNTLFIFTKSNADQGGRKINQCIRKFIDQHKDNSILVESMGQLLYLSTLKYVDIVIGNSSSGIIEAPSFKIPTINIGTRQDGRIKPESIIDCKPEKEEIEYSIKKGISDEFKSKIFDMKNPYGDGNASGNIIDILKSIDTRYFIKDFYKVKYLG